MLLMIDNYDSFTHNVARYFRELGAEINVVRNDQITVADIERLIEAQALHGVVISPGPCTPNEAGISLDAIRHCAGKVPILGVCLGHQAIGQVFGAQVVQAAQVMHGKTSLLKHAEQGLFENLPSSFRVARYHSLLLSPEQLPADLIVDAWVDSALGAREIMAIRHAHLPIWGVQYHPEAIETEYGHAIFKQFLTLSERFLSNN